MCWTNLERIRAADQIKFVIQNRADYEYARDVQLRYRLGERCAAVLYSPVHEVLAPKDLAAWILEDRLQARLQLQVHKYIWGKDTRGV
jgi:7-carboxy-7-deazaguanine synthase